MLSPLQSLPQNFFLVVNLEILKLSNKSFEVKQYPVL
nr:MAG TPA: hypothetical protein [Caudoviricetes sp.]